MSKQQLTIGTVTERTGTSKTNGKDWAMKSVAFTDGQIGKCFKGEHNAALYAALVDGASGEFELESKPDRDGVAELWIVAFGNLGGKQERGGVKGGGGRAYVPRTQAEVHGANVAGIIKSAIEATGGEGIRAASLATTLIGVYIESLQRVMAAVPRD